METKKKKAVDVHGLTAKTDRNATKDIWGIMRKGDGRYAIIDTCSGNILDNAQGNGFGSYFAAYRYGYNKFGTKGQCNGKPNVDEFNSLL